jgi:hypothetical protein
MLKYWMVMRNIFKIDCGCIPVVLLVVLAQVCVVQGQVSIWTNPITGTNPSTSNPFTSGDVVASNITVSGIGRGSGINAFNGDDRYNANSWNTNSLDVDAYFYFTITPIAGYHINLENFIYTSQASHPSINAFAFRSNINGDNYSTNIGTPDVNGETISLSSSTYQNLTTEAQFRLYAWNANNGSRTFSVNDFTFNGSILGTSLTSLTGFSTCQGTPSTAQSFVVNGSGLVPSSGDLTVAGSTNFEVSSTSATTGFSSSISIPVTAGAINTTIWVRLKAGALVGMFTNEQINVSGGGFSVANAIDVNCSGTVLESIQGSISTNGPFCDNGAGTLTWIASSGVGNYTVVYNDGVADRTALNVVSGIAFPVFTSPVTSTTTYTLVSVTGSNGCSRTSSFTGGSATLTVNPRPTITPGTNPAVCQGVTSANLTYSGTTGSPDKYSLDFDLAAETAGFSDVNLANLAGSPIVITVPMAGAPAMYNASLTVTNSTTNCTSAPVAVSVTIRQLPTAGTCNQVNDLCQTNTGAIDIKASNGLAPYTVTWTPAHGMSQPATIATNGGILTVTGLQGATTYTFVVKDANGCQAP